MFIKTQLYQRINTDDISIYQVCQSDADGTWCLKAHMRRGGGEVILTMGTEEECEETAVWLDGALGVREMKEPPHPPTVQRVRELEQQLAVSHWLIGDYNRLLKEIPECSLHGLSCIPHAIDWVKRAKAANNV